MVHYESYNDHILSTISYHDQIPAASQPQQIFNSKDNTFENA